MGVRGIIIEEIGKISSKTKVLSEECTKPPEFDRCLTNCSVQSGNPAHFVYLLKEGSCANVEWYRNGKLLTSDDKELDIVTDDSGAGCLIISQPSPLYNGIYKCHASNQHGSTMSKALLLVHSSETSQSTSSKLPNTPQTVTRSSQTAASRNTQTDENILKRHVVCSTGEEKEEEFMASSSKLPRNDESGLRDAIYLKMVEWMTWTH